MAKEEIKIKISTPEGVLYEDTTEEMMIPGKEGYFGVQPGHTPFFTAIMPGALSLFEKNYKIQEEFAIHDGFAVVNNDMVKILTETIEESEEIDVERAKKAKQRAEKRLKSKKKEIDMRRAEAALRRAITRLEVK